jgi:DNA-binding SARP family transcriptional activator
MHRPAGGPPSASPSLCRPDVPLAVRLFGGLSVDGRRPADVGTPSARTLLARLAVARGDPVPAAGLVEALWAEAIPNRGAQQIGVLVSRLRGVLGRDRIVRSPGGWALHADWLDVAELERLAAVASAELGGGRPAAASVAAEASLAVVRGELLADQPDALWAHAERTRVGFLVGHARRLVADAALAAGRPDDAAAAASRALAADAYDEGALRTLMRAHAAAGRPAAALAAYLAARERVAHDFGVGLDARTEAVHDEVVVGRRSPTEPSLRPPRAPLHHQSRLWCRSHHASTG